MSANIDVSVTWLGQAGLLIVAGGMRVIVDPYLSDSVGAIDSSKHRRQPVDKKFLQIQPDVLICTHDHLDHTDPETLKHYLAGTHPVTVLAPGRAWERVRTYGGSHNYVQFNRFTEWSIDDLRIVALPAEHSDPDAIGVLLYVDNRVFYITGDTLYNRTVLDAVPAQVDVVFLPINGVGNNMNTTDAARFAKHIGARRVVPVHWGLFDNITPELPGCENVITPKIYEEMTL